MYVMYVSVTLNINVDQDSILFGVVIAPKCTSSIYPINNLFYT